MKKTSSLLLLVILLAGLLSGCQMAGSQPVQVSEKNAGTTIALKPGETLVVALEGNITTGYIWVAANQNPLLLEQKGDPEVATVNEDLGAPGTIALTFEAVAKGETLLHLDYIRPWESNAAPEKTFEITVVVE